MALRNGAAHSPTNRYSTAAAGEFTCEAAFEIELGLIHALGCMKSSCLPLQEAGMLVAPCHRAFFEPHQLEDCAEACQA